MATEKEIHDSTETTTKTESLIEDTGSHHLPKELTTIRLVLILLGLWVRSS